MKRIYWILALVLVVAVAGFLYAQDKKPRRQSEVAGMIMQPGDPTENDEIVLRTGILEASGTPTFSESCKIDKNVITVDIKLVSVVPHCAIEPWCAAVRVGKLEPGEYVLKVNAPNFFDGTKTGNFTVAESDKGKNLAPELKKNIKELINKLGDEKAEVAEKAQKESIKLAEDATVRPFVEERVKGLLDVGRVKDPQRLRKRQRAVKILETIRKNLKARIESLIRKLGSEKFKEREAAQKELVKIGEPAVPQLKGALKSKVIEVSTRAQRILLKLEQIKMEYPIVKALKAANRITVNGEVALTDKERISKVVEFMREKGYVKRIAHASSTKICECASSLNILFLTHGSPEPIFTIDRHEQPCGKVFLVYENRAGLLPDRMLDDLVDFVRKLAQEEKALARRIDKLVKQLGSEKLQEREEAEKELVKIGEPVIPQLRKALKDAKDPEVKKGIEKIFKALK